MGPHHELVRCHLCMTRPRPRLVPRFVLIAALACVSCEAQPASATPTPPPESPDRPAADPPPEPGHVPAPEPDLVPQPQPAPEPKPPSFGHADLDPSNDGETGPLPALEDCEDQLAAEGVTFKPARIGVGRKRDGVYTCGAHQVVRVRKGPGDIRYSSNPLLSCQMALAMADFERVVQREAQRHLDRRVVRIDHLGTYNCREMANYELISEHSFANAIDLRRFHLEGGGTVDVLDHFAPDQGDPPDPKSAFLRALAQRLYDEDVFSNVITPYFDEIHRNHIHVDLARYRTDGTRP